jgi:predicted DNA-binding transcriptional regulator AlpA
MQAIAETPRLVLKLGEVAERFGVHPRTIQRMIHSGDFPPPTCKAGRIPLWVPAVVEEFARGEWSPAPRPARSRKAAAE